MNLAPLPRRFAGSSTVLAAAVVMLAAGSWSGAATIVVPDDQPTIQDAVNHAFPGDEIVLDDGTYDESVDLDSMGSDVGWDPGDLTIRAANPLAAAVNGSTGSAFRATAYAGDLTIRDLNLTAFSGIAGGVVDLVDVNGVVALLGNAWTSGYGGAGVRVVATGAARTTFEVRGNTFDTPADNRHAIDTLVFGAPTFDLIVEGNTFTMLQDDGVKLNVQTPSGPGGPVVLARIRGNTFNPAAASGSAVDLDLGDTGSVGTVASVSIEDNEILGTVSDEAVFIDVEGGGTWANLIIRNNRITSSGQEGLTIDGGSSTADSVANILIEGNTVSNAAGSAGIRVRPQDAGTGTGSLWNIVIRDNEIASPLGNGLVVDAGSADGNFTLNLDLVNTTVTGVMAPFAAYRLDQNVGTVQLEQGASASTDPATVIADNGNAGVPVTIIGVVTVAADALDDGWIPANLGDFVWSDTDGDGVQGAGEPGAAGIPVALEGTLSVNGGAVEFETVSDSTGVYLFPAMLPADATLTVAPSELFVGLSPRFAGGDPALDSDFDPVTGQAEVSLTADDLDVDAGLIPFDPVILSGGVFEDLTADGSVTGDPALPGASLELWRDGGDTTPDFGAGDDAPVSGTLTLADGSYGFAGVGSGLYFIRQLLPMGFVQTTSPTVFAVTTVSGADVAGLDLGVAVLGSIHGFAYDDLDADGVYDDGVDSPLEGVEFALSGSNGLGGAVMATTTSAADGTFAFTGLVPSVDGAGAGTGYTVTETVPAGAAATTAVTFSGDVSSRRELVAFDGQAGLGPDDPRLEVSVGAALRFGTTTSADIEVTVAESVDPAVAGSGVGNLTYVVTATNNGPTAASGVVVSQALTLPAGVALESVTPSAGTWADPEWRIGSLGNGASATLTIVLTVAAGAEPGTDVITSAAELTAVDDPEIDAGNDAASESTSIEREVDLVLVTTDSPDPWSPGESLVYTLTVTNMGPSDATGVVVTDSLPAAVALVATSGCTEDPDGAPTCTLGSIAAGDSARYTIEVAVGPDPPPMITNTATATSTEPELDEVDNTDDETTTLDTTAPTVTGVSAGGALLEECATASEPIGSLRVEFSEPVRDPPGDGDNDDVTNPANYLVVATGPDLEFSTAGCGSVFDDDVAAPISGVHYEVSTRTATLATGLLPSSQVRVMVCGSTSIRDLAGNPLDGTGDGAGGDDFVLTFRSDPGNRFANGHFDCAATGLGPWVPSDPAEITYSSDDAGSSSISGSAQVRQLAANTSFRIDQCVVVLPGTGSELRSRWKLETAGFLSYSRDCEFFTAAGCGAAGSGIGRSIISDLVGDTGGSWVDTLDLVDVPLSAASARCGFVFATPTGLDFSAGLDELYFGNADQIFADGFESGDASRWSSVVP